MFFTMDEVITIETVCPFCGEVSTIEVPASGFFAWQHGELIQKAFPTLSAEIREQLISGICPDCWNNAFK